MHFDTVNVSHCMILLTWFKGDRGNDKGKQIFTGSSSGVEF